MKVMHLLLYRVNFSCVPDLFLASLLGGITMKAEMYAGYSNSYIKMLYTYIHTQIVMQLEQMDIISVVMLDF